MSEQAYTLRAQIGAPPEAVYAALTEAAAQRAWLAECAEVSLDDGAFEFWGRYTPEGERGRRTEGYQLGWMEFLASLKRMHEAGAGWRPVQTVQ
jgi:hypothetical protein